LARIALDVMGGDHAPRTPVAGALLALAELDGDHVVQLVGPTAVVEAELARQLAGEHSAVAGRRDRLEIVEAPDVIGMSDRPTTVLKKPASSMSVGLMLQRDGRSDAFISAGNTGAQMAASSVLLKLHPGLERPAIATIFPTARQPVVVLDCGANVDCGAAELVQFARLGVVYAEDVLGRPNPSVGLLSIGEEPEKGNASVKEANQLLQAAGINFHGNVEGRDLPRGGSDRGPVDVVVCDGFTGNVLLKFYEAITPMFLGMLEAHAGLDAKALRAAFRELDSDEYGGAPLLGVRGVSIICHGSSNPQAIKNGIRGAVRAVESRMNEHIGRRLAGAA
jgi:phosphate acyltransferase